MPIKLFINYRREDSIAAAGRLYDRLVHEFGRQSVFMDVDHIPAGHDFHSHLDSQIALSNVVLVIIGPRWLSAADDKGVRRIDKPDDFVSIEIAAALDRQIRVIPVLIDGARMPQADELPASLAGLARRNAVEIRNTQFGSDATRLIEKLREASVGRPSRRLPWVIGAIAVLGAAALFRFWPEPAPVSEPQASQPDPVLAVPKAAAPTGPKQLSRIRLRQGVLIRVSETDWQWIETDPRDNREHIFNFRALGQSERDLLLYDGSRDMYARLDFVDRRAYWRIGTQGQWNWNYDIVEYQ